MNKIVFVLISLLVLPIVSAAYYPYKSSYDYGARFKHYISYDYKYDRHPWRYDDYPFHRYSYYPEAHITPYMDKYPNLYYNYYRNSPYTRTRTSWRY